MWMRSQIKGRLLEPVERNTVLGRLCFLPALPFPPGFWGTGLISAPVSSRRSEVEQQQQNRRRGRGVCSLAAAGDSPAARVAYSVLVTWPRRRRRWSLVFQSERVTGRRIHWFPRISLQRQNWGHLSPCHWFINPEFYNISKGKPCE